ncbi:MAG: glutaminyl-peptide cyclotransferase [Pirellulales bacterium]|nr:glutaminyl-peptide cyclotransferase [Pirellulales bacterium]
MSRRKKNKPHQGRCAATPEPGQGVRRRWIGLSVAAVSLIVLGIATWAPARDPAPTVHGFEVVNTYTHDSHAFCQGLAFSKGVLYEGTGKYGKSTLRRVDLATGEVLQQVQLDRNLFGEGITIWDDRIYQLTWRSGVGIIYDKKTFAKLETFRFRGEGWGLTHDEEHLILSDGSSVLYFLNPTTFREVRRVVVRDGGIPVANLNELEYVEGKILANVWGSDQIARIAPETGEVIARINLRGLAPPETRRNPDAVLNGIAYDAKNQRLFVTGKNWPTLYEIRLKPL